MTDIRPLATPSPTPVPLSPGLIDCPETGEQAKTDKRFQEYNGNPLLFHCGDDIFTQRNAGDGVSAQQECVYDKTNGTLVTGWCGGSPNEYDSKEHPILHTFADRGGILSLAGLKGLLASVGTGIQRVFEGVVDLFR